MKEGKLIILVAPSGGGKSTLAKRLFDDFDQLRLSVSATTRAPREGEQDGVHYYFISHDEFQQRIDNNEFVEWEEFYNGTRYGTLQSDIENKIKISPFIKDTIVIGDRRKFLSALIAIEFDTVSNWALRKNIPHTTYRDLSEKKQVKDLIWKEIVKANENTSSLEIRKFRMIPKELDHEDGELTATQKIKRNVLMEQFSDLIEEMYS